MPACVLPKRDSKSQPNFMRRRAKSAGQGIRHRSCWHWFTKQWARRPKPTRLYARGLRLAQAHLDLHPDDARGYYLAASALAELGEKDRSIKLRSGHSNSILMMPPLFMEWLVYMPNLATSTRLWNCWNRQLNVDFNIATGSKTTQTYSPFRVIRGLNRCSPRSVR